MKTDGVEGKNVEQPTTKLVVQKTITAAKWKKAENAFFQQVDVKRNGSIENLRCGLLAAAQELMS